MRAVAYRLRITLRSRWGSTLWSTVAVALVVGAVLAIAAGAHRTATAPNRYTDRYSRGVDLTVTQMGGAPRTKEVERLAAVRRADSLTFVFGALMSPTGADPGSAERLESLTFFGTVAGSGSHIVAGRETDLSVPGEFVANRAFIAATGAKLGDHYHLVTLSAAQAGKYGFQLPEDEAPQGPELDAVLVGITESPSELDDPSAIAMFSPALVQEYEGRPADRRLAISASPIAVDLEPGATEADLRAQLRALPPVTDDAADDPIAASGGSDPFEVSNDPFVTTQSRAAVNAQATGLWAVAAVAAFAGLVLLGQFLARRVRLGADERRVLSAVGLTRGQALAEMLGRAAIPAVAGSALGAALAVLPSDRFPASFARRLEPEPGLSVDGWVLVGGAAAIAVALCVWTLSALLLTTRRVRAHEVSATGEAVASRFGEPSVATGLRFAFTRAAGGSGSARGALSGLVLTTTLLVGALTFGSSLSRLLDEPWRYGVVQDLSIGQGEDRIQDETLRRLVDDPDVDAVTYFANATAQVGSTQLALLGMETKRGHLVPPVLEGRLPEAADEIALGRLSSKELIAPVGSEITVRTEALTRRFRVTGLAVQPGLGGSDGIGHDGLITREAFVSLYGDGLLQSAGATVRPGSPPGTPAAVYRRAYGVSDAPAPGEPPPEIVNVARTRSTPYLLVGVLGALGALTAAYVVATSIRRRRRDVTILRAVGADRRWLSRATHSQATALVIAGVIGIPIGIILGSRAFQAFANSVGVVNAASVPFAAAALVVVASVVLANVVSAVVTRGLVRGRPGTVLRTE